MGRELYWFTVVAIQGAEEGTDGWAAENGWISLQQLRGDFTNYTQFVQFAAASVEAGS